MLKTPIITNKGIKLLSKITNSTLTLSKMSLGSGEKKVTSEVDNLQNEVLKKEIEVVEVQNGTIVARTTFTNETLKDGFYIKEVGIYALDPDEGEILYAYTSVEETEADFFSPGTGIVILREMVELAIGFGNADKIELTIDPKSVFLTVDDALNEGDIDSIVNGTYAEITSSKKFLSGLGLKRFWTKIKDYVTNKIDGIEVGGRNLAEGTNQGISNWKWSMQIGTATVEEFVDSDGVRCCKLVRSDVEQSGYSFISFGNVNPQKYKPSTQYTISFRVKPSVNTSIRVGVIKSDSTGAILPLTDAGNITANEWNYVSLTLTSVAELSEVSNQVLYISAMDSSIGVSYIFRDLKIERGTEATDWTPATEDNYNNYIKQSSIVHNADVTDTGKVPGMDLINNLNTRIVETEESILKYVTENSDGRTIFPKDSWFARYRVTTDNNAPLSSSSKAYIVEVYKEYGYIHQTWKCIEENRVFTRICDIQNDWLWTDFKELTN